MLLMSWQPFETPMLYFTMHLCLQVQYKRAEVVKSQSVHELSQINSLSDFPVPEAIENIVKKGHGPIERKKKFKEM